MEAVTIDHDPPTINHTNVRSGQTLTWGFGEESAPEDLSGRVVELILDPGTQAQQRDAMSVAAPLGLVSWAVPATWRGPSKYLILVDGEAWVEGLLQPAATRVTP
ncbi:hypothetical protein DAERI_060088 [Deinococcus aerius]|uniref:Uncharacterized protein n=1 Tax=Deinococcus aerius TaxID=200253 RepID=A0A2I9DHY0_9DEIO|nr:hypothetical protein [Deinococcus aerius]GBF05828.1 hypothetical protein DAERI_060088 [Deinococcus aerius]